MTSILPTGAPDVTRRQALQAGAGGAAAAFLMMYLPTAAGASPAGQRHLLRSAWRDLSAPHLRSGASLLRLESVGDLSAAPAVRSLRDSEDAFSLVLSGPPGMANGNAPLRVRHDELGTFDLFVSPVADNRYEAVVNRVLSNSESRRTPPRRAAPAPAPAPATTAVAPSRPARSGEPVRKRVIRRVRVTRGKKGAKVVVDLQAGAGVDELSVWLKRHGKVVAAASKGIRPGRKRATVYLKPRKRLRKGRYEVDVMALGRDGEQSHRRAKARLR